MPRPQPLFIPGPTGMGGRHTATQVDLNLGTIAQLYDKLIAQPQRDQAAAQAILEGAPEIAKMFGIGAAPAPKDLITARTLELPTGGAINLPPPGQAMEQQATRQQGIGKISSSPMARTILQDLMGKIATPKEFNIPGDVDTFLMGSQSKHGFDYTSPIGREQSWRWFGTPQGQEAYGEWMQKQSAGRSVASWIPVGVDSETGDFWSFNRRDPENNGNPTYMNMRTQEKMNQPPRQLISGNLKTATTPIISQANLTKSAIQRLENMAKYYKPEYVGIIQGRIANVERKLKELPPDQVKFYREFKQLNDDIIRAKEGAVVPEAMVKRLEQFMNDIKQPSANFESQLDSLTDYVRDQGMNLDESLTGQYISPFKEKHRKFWENRGSILGKNPVPISGNAEKSKFTILKVE